MMLNSTDAAAIAYLRSPVAIRQRCEQLFNLACADELRYFRCDLSQLDRVAQFVLQVTRDHYPDFQIPFHSRWRHFEVGDAARLTQFAEKLVGLSPLEQAWAKFDLVIVSVLLDAGAGADWQYQEPATGQIFSRSEGLAVASFDLFCQGVFSSNFAAPLQVDATGLQQLTTAALEQGLQVSSQNPLIGVAGRVHLLQQLGRVLQQSPHLFGNDQPARPGYLVNFLLTQVEAGCLEASQIFSAVLEGLSEIWAGRLTIAGVNLGDVWQHSALNRSAEKDSLPADRYPSLVPFHKLSQWLTYSLLEPLQELGLKITGLDTLTGLPEYRNGGLCLDLGLLQVKDTIVDQHPHPPGSEVIVEWRALTVILLDRIAQTIRHCLNQSAEELPLVKVLQGGTWMAGRRIAAELRPHGVPPIQIDSDGTVF